jgi:hypothetical protein
MDTLYFVLCIGKTNSQFFQRKSSFLEEFTLYGPLTQTVSMGSIFSIMTLSAMGLFVTFSITDTEYMWHSLLMTQSTKVSSVIMLSIQHKWHRVYVTLSINDRALKFLVSLCWVSLWWLSWRCLWTCNFWELLKLRSKMGDIELVVEFRFFFD